MVDSYGAKHFSLHSHVGLQFMSSPYRYFVALCLFHSVLYSVRVLYLVRILYPVRSPRFIPSPRFILRPQSAVLILYWPVLITMLGRVLLRADLHDTILSNATSSRQAYHMIYDCRSVLKHVLKCYDIFLTYTTIVNHVVGLS